MFVYTYAFSVFVIVIIVGLNLLCVCVRAWNAFGFHASVNRSPLSLQPLSPSHIGPSALKALYFLMWKTPSKMAFVQHGNPFSFCLSEFVDFQTKIQPPKPISFQQNKKESKIFVYAIVSFVRACVRVFRACIFFVIALLFQRRQKFNAQK